MVSLRPLELSLLEWCLYYRERDCMNFGIFVTNTTVRIADVVGIL